MAELFKGWLRSLMLSLVMLVTLSPSGQAAGFDILPTPQLPQVIVRENFIQQATKCIEETLASQGELRRFKVEAVNVPAGLRLPMGSISYASYVPGAFRLSRPMQVNVEVMLDGQLYATMNCIMRVRFYSQVVTAARRIPSETPITMADLLIEEKEDKGEAYKRYTDFSQVLGKVVTTTVPAGFPLHSGVVKEPILIKANSKVHISANVNGVVITMDGTAMERGRRNAYIKVRNDSTGKYVQGKVIDEMNVEVRT